MVDPTRKGLPSLLWDQLAALVRTRFRGQHGRMPQGLRAADSDPMILPHYSYLLAGLIPHAQVKIYPDAAHGFLFHHHAQFAADVEAFLSDPG